MKLDDQMEDEEEEDDEEEEKENEEKEGKGKREEGKVVVEEVEKTNETKKKGKEKRRKKKQEKEDEEKEKKKKKKHATGSHPVFRTTAIRLIHCLVHTTSSRLHSNYLNGCGYFHTDRRCQRLDQYLIVSTQTETPTETFTKTLTKTLEEKRTRPSSISKALDGTSDGTGWSSLTNFRTVQKAEHLFTQQRTMNPISIEISFKTLSSSSSMIRRQMSR